MKCKYCGHTIYAGDDTCEKCGAPATGSAGFSPNAYGTNYEKNPDGSPKIPRRSVSSYPLPKRSTSNAGPFKVMGTVAMGIVALIFLFNMIVSYDVFSVLFRSSNDLIFAAEYFILGLLPAIFLISGIRKNQKDPGTLLFLSVMFLIILFIIYLCMPKNPFSDVGFAYVIWVYFENFKPIAILSIVATVLFIIDNADK